MNPAVPAGSDFQPFVDQHPDVGDFLCWDDHPPYYEITRCEVLGPGNYEFDLKSHSDPRGRNRTYLRHRVPWHARWVSIACIDRDPWEETNVLSLAHP